MKRPVAVLTSLLAFFAQARKPCGSCTASADWPGWAGIERVFVFGDSYTTTGFDASGTQPTASNPLGNPSYPGWTSANGPNWVDFLTTEYNASVVLTYNLADGGATVDSDLVAPYLPTVRSLKVQVQDVFADNYAAAPESTPWTSESSLFAIWIGINDVGNTWWKEDYADIVALIMDEYTALVDELYSHGARNFVFLNVPPVERAPLTLEQGEASIEAEGAAIAHFNGMVKNAVAQKLKAENADVNAWLVDSYKSFSEVLDDPSSYPQTSGYVNLTAYCEAYQNGTPQPDTLDAACGVSVDQYFWLNSLHPTFPMHEVVAEQVATVLASDPNIC